MIKRGYIIGLFITLNLSFLTGTIAQVQNSATRLSIGEITGLPSSLIDTSSYTFGVYVTNEDPQRPLANPLNLRLSVDGDEGTDLVSNFALPVPILPGDSVFVPVVNHQFDAIRFTGGGITHDIIVWPMALGVISTDTTEQPVHYQHTLSTLSQTIGIEEPLPIPGTIIEGTAYSFILDIINLDSTRDLIHPVTVMMSIDGDQPTVLIGNVSPDDPVEPGGSFQIPVSSHIFNSARFSGGGITHDIIVWPMALSVSNPDTSSITVSFVWELSGYEGPSPGSPSFGGEGLGLPSNQVTMIPPKQNSTSLQLGIIPIGTGLELTWTTPYETEGMIFQIYRGTLEGDLQLLEQIEGKGNPELPYGYHFTDRNPLTGFNQYHLVGYAPNGSTAFHADGGTNWYPARGPVIKSNPVSDNLEMTLSLGNPESIQVFIMDQRGRTVAHQTYSGHYGINDVRVPLLSHPAGIYIYKVLTGENAWQGKIVKQ